MKRILAACLIAAVLLLGVFVTGLAAIDLSFARESVEDLASDLLRMRIDVDGELSLRLGLTPGLELGGLALRATGSSPSPLFHATRPAASARLIDLLRGRLHLTRVTLDRAVVDYCADLPATKPDTTDSGPPSIAITTLEANSITITCGGRDEAEAPAITLTRLRGSAPATAPIEAAATVRVAGLDLELEATARTAALNELLRKPAALPLTARATAAGDTVGVAGQVFDLFEDPVATATVDVDLADIRNWSEIIGFGPREPTAFAAAGRIRADTSGVELADASVSVGDAAFDIAAAVRWDAARPVLRIAVAGERFDVGGFLNDDPADTAAADVDFEPVFDAAREFDAEASLQIGRLEGLPLPLRDVELSADLSGGHLEVRRVAFGHADTRFAGAARLDLQADCPNLTATATIEGLTTDELKGLIGPTPIAVRIDDANIEWSSCGQTLLAHRASARGKTILSGATFRVDDAALPGAIERLRVTGGWELPLRAELAGTWLTERVTATLASGSLAELVAGSRSAVRVDARGAGAILSFSGYAAVAPDDPRLKGEATISAHRIGSTSAWTGVRPEAAAPVAVKAHVDIRTGALTLDQLTANVGGSDAFGSLALADSSNGWIGNLKVRSHLIDFAELERMLPPPDKPDTADSASAAPREFRLRDVRLPRIDFDVGIATVRLEQTSVTELETSGRMRNALIDDARLAMRVEGTDLRGTVDLDFRAAVMSGRVTMGATNVDIGRLLAAFNVVEDLDARAERLEVELVSQGSTLPDLVQNQELTAELRELYWQARDPEVRRISELRIRDLTVSAAPGAPTVWKSSGLLNRVPATLWIETPSLPDTFAEGKPLPLAAALLTDEDVVFAHAVLERDATGIVAVRFDASGERVEGRDIDLENLRPPLSRYRLEAHVAVEPDAVRFTDITARLGESRAEGRIDIAQVGDRRSFRAEVRARHIQTDDFVDFAARWQDASEQKDSPAPETANDRTLVDALVEIVDELTARTSYDIDVTIGELFAGADRLGSAHARLFVDDDELHLEPARISLPGGDVEGRYHLRVAPGDVDLELRVHAERLAYGGLLRLLDAESDAAGLAYFDMDLTSSAPSQDEVRRNLSGHFDLVAIPKDVSAGVLDLWAANVVLAVLPIPEGSRRKMMNCLVARLVVDDGVMKTKNVMLDTTDVIVRGRGTIDIDEERLDLIFAPQAKREKFFSVSTPVAVTGPWDDFQLGVNPGGIMITLSRLFLNLIYVPFKWLTGERFPSDGLPTCFKAMNWDYALDDVESMRQQLEEMRPGGRDAKTGGAAR